MIPALFAARRPSTASALKGFAIVATIAGAMFFTAPREANAFFEDEAFAASYEAYLASWTAWYSDGDAVEGNYHYWATVYAYYGYFYAAYGDWYDYDPYFEYANVYLQASSELWEAIVFYNVGGYDSYVAGLAAGAAADWCYWAWLF